MYTKKTHPKTSRIAGNSFERQANSEVEKRPTKVVPIRLSEDKRELMRDEANELGIGPSTLARIWILDSLRKTNGSNHNGNGNPDSRPLS